MSRRANTAVAGVAGVACAACCAGPIIAVVTALGVATILGAVVSGFAVLVIGTAAIALVVVRRRPDYPGPDVCSRVVDQCYRAAHIRHYAGSYWRR